MPAEKGRKALISLRVQPKSSSLRISEQGGRFKAHLTAAPERGKANAQLLEYLSDIFGVPKSAVSLLSGETGRTKTVAVEGLSDETAVQLLREAVRRY